MASPAGLRRSPRLAAAHAPQQQLAMATLDLSSSERREKKASKKALRLAAAAQHALDHAMAVRADPSSSKEEKTQAKRAAKEAVALAAQAEEEVKVLKEQAAAANQLGSKKRKHTEEQPHATNGVEEGGVSKKSSKKKKSNKAAEEKAVEEVQVKKKQKKQEGVAVSPTKRLFGYTEHADVARMTSEDVDAFRLEHAMRVTGNNVESFRPVRSFAHLDFPADVMQCCRAFKQPTAIQAQAWPIVASGRDVIGIAKTGSGKTLGFLLPALRHMKLIDVTKKFKGPMMIVMSPTRELAMQTAEVCAAAGAGCGVSNVCVYGGDAKGPQVAALKAGVHIVVATPGRLLALAREGVCDLSSAAYLVLDEADRMLDQGFEADIRAIVAMCPPKQTGVPGEGRQTLLFSATWPQAVERLGYEFTHDAVHVRIGDPSCELTSNKDVHQTVEVVEEFAKDKLLLKLLEKYHKTRKNRVIIFALYKKDIGRLEQFLAKNGWEAVGMSSDYSQAQRTKALEGFRAGTHPLLIATDVAGRGIDVPDVEYVINYSFPLTIEDYVHRIGRTGRGGKKGAAHTFFTKNDKGLAGALVNVLKEANMAVPPELLKFGTAVKKKQHDMYGAFAGRDDRPMPERKKVVF